MEFQTYFKTWKGGQVFAIVLHEQTFQAESFFYFQEKIISNIVCKYWSDLCLPQHNPSHPSACIKEGKDADTQEKTKEAPNVAH